MAGACVVIFILGALYEGLKPHTVLTWLAILQRWPQITHSVNLTRYITEMVGACVVIFILGALYEGLKYLRENLLRCANQKRRYISSISLPSGTSASSKEAMVVEPSESVS